MLDNCANWLAFVEGISENRVWTSWSTGRTYYFMDWWGCGLSKAKQYPVSLKFGDKVVYAPHYYPPNVYPSEYFFGEGFSELPDYQLKANVQGTFDLMFGYLTQDPSSPALVLGEFGGLYTNDLNPGRTIQRAVNYTVELLMRPGFVGGYMWSLNPESGYDYNRRNVQGTFKEGLLQNDWRTANEPYLAALSPTDKMADLKRLPCFKRAP
ncbi:hypothetical protein Poli38472_002788 [Pythium oligandrum]|uniref:Glycoside hydrolase family 5 domain-containing protein n=1 Tax=Pythium oligandrum TaxID=41045 RepID=A0A8K1CI59_PYTOL|nr:hypothetical protein Poli38472_002788 [Pythium oligandrum]|eukprot:TMW63847.1 hypothetical protein Poli38472_002788 [Pythium oligandrum]